jgi:alkaline phosphatase D
MKINRRAFLVSSAGLALGSCASKPHNSAAFNTFQHGVASGDPLSDRVILWTRITPESSDIQNVEVQWHVYADAQSHQLVKQGKVLTGAARDFTVKLDATGLMAGHDYFYQFKALGHTSPMGRTRTVSDSSLEELNLAVLSCANYIYGHFNVYGAVAKNENLDAVLFLGDYLYEYANSPAKKTPKIRTHLPDHEITVLEDYRLRHAQYKTDTQLQAAHARHPFITVWDDHESANNGWETGAQNHNPELDEGTWEARKRAAIRAYFEWMPIRAFPEEPASRIYRSFAFGDLVDIMMLDTRLEGRKEQAPADSSNEYLKDPSRRIISDQQSDWLEEQLVASQQRNTHWRLIGQQVMFGQLIVDNKVLNTDQWDGYPGSRTKVLDMIEKNNIDNVAILTGDIHSSWAMDISRDPFEDNPKSLAVEFVTPSVTSPAVTDPVEAKERAEGIMQALPHLHFVDLNLHGYISISINKVRIKSSWKFVDTVLSTDYQEYTAATLICDSGSARLRQA